MSKKRICYRCGKPAVGYASVWTQAEGTRWYCHGDDDDVTCYEQQSWADAGYEPAKVMEFLFGEADG